MTKCWPGVGGHQVGVNVDADRDAKITDVWAAEQSFAAFGEIIGPAMQRAGLVGTPKAHPVQRIVTQDGKRAR